MVKNDTPKYDQLEDLPSLKKGWVRLVHRCIYKDHVDSIKENGLVFNRNAAQLSPFQKGGSYPNITSMASVYDEASFWKSMQHDDFSCYDNARYADTKIIFDMPMDEFCLLETCGRHIKGKIDRKYIVACIRNANGENKSLQVSQEKIMRAAGKSRNNLPTRAQPNNISDMIENFLLKCKSNKKEELRTRIYERIERCEEDLRFEQNELKTTQSRERISLTDIRKTYSR